MKKITLLILLTILLVSVSSVTTFAQDSDGECKYHENHDDSSITVGVIDGDISEEDLEDFISFLKDENPIQEKSICLVHDYVYKGTVFAVTHKVYTSQPRCLEKTYKLYECSNCGAKKYVLISSRRIVCCN